ncbi:trk system potassium uptake protein TrkA [Thermanaeromonas toyohensis ToBE]|uniref:Trk system potassium uptake protein TrkA n=1 Tax=Thermanaeromonas toyohensis ToBE TaxID=698762 RepID=A0A1W1W059_9FIRM|nr:TrkA family potassium uptake protein [Thermanaeromonas toyohensis]SMB98966.1 trk system potassium uptake protein TrkA [Thermanaeromonas toyohensis ToBE]
MKQFAVIGLGRFGSSVATALARMGCQVLAIDSDAEKVEAIMDEVTHAIQADARDEEALKAAGIRNVDVAIVAIGENVEANILVTLIVKELGVKCVVAKALNDLHAKVLAKIGADKIVFPERDMGVRVARTLAAGNVLEHIDLSPDYSIVEIAASHRLAGKTLGQLNLRARHGIMVVAIKHGDNIVVAPGAEDVVREGDILVLIGPTKVLERLEERE